MDATPIDYNDIRKCMVSAGVMAEQYVFDDKEYVCPTREWLEKTFHPDCTSYLNEMDIPPVSPTFITNKPPVANACTKLAIAVRFYAVWLFSDTFPDSPYALALGTYAFDRPSPWPGHKLNVAIVKEDNILTPVFYEGHVGIKQLTEENLRLCRHYLF